MASSTDFTIGPTVSNLGHNGTTPLRFKRLWVVLRPTKLFHAAGTLTEPPVSEPIEPATRFKVTLTAAPEEDPPGAK